MKKLIAAAFMLTSVCLGQAQSSKLSFYAQELLFDQEQRPNYLRLKENYRVAESETASFLESLLFSSNGTQLVQLRREQDELGFTHIRYQVFVDGAEVNAKIVVAHLREGKLISVNGDLYAPAKTVNTFILSEGTAFTAALQKVNAEKYKWENKAEEQHMREALNEPEFSYFPKAERVMIEKEGKTYCAFRFQIYAETPLYKANVFVDASTGAILDEQNLICTVDVPGTAVTKYSGTQTITCNQNGAQFTLFEAVRGAGQGMATYNCGNTQNYVNTNFTSSSANWTLSTTDQGALDAHWGAEKTYDYYWSTHNRNSINNSGYKLVSYVHYGTNYTNAFWDGTRMTYGDGNGTSLKIFTALDVCGHEITHGLTSNTGNLAYQNESGALNESYSDIFGTCIENFARPGNWNWKIGEDLTNNSALRSMSNPNSFGDPDTYGGTNYYTGTNDNGGVHTNSGVSNFYFYLLTQGGGGTNDLAQTYTVTGLGFNSASRIAFRALTVYFTPSTTYTVARNLSIQAAKDLFGDCSNEMIQTMNAWHAVGVGAKYIPGQLNPNFTAGTVNFCTLPATVNFVNTTSYASTYLWNFGDGGTATSTNAVHTYTAAGSYTVKLKAGGCNSVDSITKPSYVVILIPNTPVTSNVTSCENTSATLTASGNSVIKWYDNAGNVLSTGNTFITPTLNANATYYVANTVPNSPVFGGILSNVGGGNLNNTNQYLIFDVVQSCTLNSVVVYASGAGTRTVELRDNSNNVLNQVPVYLNNGSNTVTLGIPLTVGSGYRMALGGTVANLYRSNSGVTYPYNIGGCVNIVNSSAGLNAYYWYYNWSVTKDDCLSPMVPVNITVNGKPQVSMTAIGSVVCKDDNIGLMGSPAGGSFSGTGVTGSNFNASMSGAGAYTVTYAYTDNNGCVGTDQKTFQADECTGISVNSLNSGISIYPNPVKDKISVNAPANTEITVSITDVAGRLVIEKTGQGTISTDMSNFAEGMYMVNVAGADGKLISSTKVVKQ